MSTSRKAARTGESARVVYEETRRQAGGRAMRFRWPEGTAFTRVVLDVEQSCCGHCGRRWHICDHRIRRIYTLAGPQELCCRLVHCCDPGCPLRCRTLSPRAELA